MTEGPTGAPHTRGKRNPALAAQLLAEQMAEEAEAREENLGDSVGDSVEDVGVVFIRRGRRVFAKQTSPFQLGRGSDSHYFSFGIEDDVDPEADLSEIFEDLTAICANAVLGMAANMQSELDELYAQPIKPQRR